MTGPWERFQTPPQEPDPEEQAAGPWEKFKPKHKSGYRVPTPEGGFDGPSIVPATRSMGEFAQDAGLAVATGLTRGAAGVAQLPVDAANAAVKYSPVRMMLDAVSPETGRKVQDLLRIEQPAAVQKFADLAKQGADAQTERMSDGQAAAAEEFGEADGVIDSAKALWRNPAFVATQGVEVAGQMIPGGVAAKSLGVLTRGVGAVGMNAGAQSGMAGSLAQDDIQMALESMPISKMREHEDFEALKLRLELNSDEEVRRWLIQNNGTDGFAQSFAINLATSYMVPGALTVESAMLGKAAREGSGRIKNAVGGGLGEGTSEAIAEGGEQASQNVQTYRPIEEGVGKSALLGGVLGVGMGTTAGFLQKPAQKLRGGDDLLSGGNVLDENGTPVDPTDDRSPVNADEIIGSAPFEGGFSQSSPIETPPIRSDEELAAEQGPVRPLDPEAFDLREFETSRDELAKELNLDDEAKAKVDRLRPKPQRDAVTGFHRSEARVPFVRRVIEHVDTTGEDASYIEADIRNLGGLNAELGNSAANEVYRELADTVRQALEGTGAQVVPVRNGGDEFSFTVVGAEQADIAAALADADLKVQDLIEARGLSNLKHPKGSAPGVGLIHAFQQIQPKQDLAELFGAVDQEIERRKKDLSDGNGAGEAARTELNGLEGQGGVLPQAAAGGGIRPQAGVVSTDGQTASPDLTDGIQTEVSPTEDPERFGFPKPIKPRNKKHKPEDFDQNYDDLLDFVALNGGVNRELMKSEGFDPAEWSAKNGKRNQRFIGKPVFKKGAGMTPDGLRERLQEIGFLDEDPADSTPVVGDDDAIQLLMRAANGERIMTSQGKGLADQIADIEREQEEQARDVEMARELDMSVPSMREALAQFREGEPDPEDVEPADIGEARSLTELAEIATELGVDEEVIIDSSFAESPAEAARLIWAAIAEKRKPDGSVQGTKNQDREGGDKASPRPASERKPDAAATPAAKPEESGQAEGLSGKRSISLPKITPEVQASLKGKSIAFDVDGEQQAQEADALQMLKRAADRVRNLVKLAECVAG